MPPIFAVLRLRRANSYFRSRDMRWLIDGFDS